MKCPNCGAVLKLTGKEIIGIETGYEIHKICNECNYLFMIFELEGEEEEGISN